MNTTGSRIVLRIGKALLLATATVSVSTLANRVMRESTSDLAESLVQLGRFAKNTLKSKKEAA